MEEIRPARPDDLPDIVAISNWAAKHTAANFAVEPETLDAWEVEWRDTHEMYPWFVAVQCATPTSPTPRPQGTGRIVGFAKASPWKGRCAYRWTAEVTVYVHPDHQGRGIARALYDKLMPTLKAQGYHTLLAGITTPNPASVHLHESFGFQRAARFERLGWKFDRWHDVGYWEAALHTADQRPEPIKPVCEVLRTESK